jgi:hypothetical protein
MIPLILSHHCTAVSSDPHHLLRWTVRDHLSERPNPMAVMTSGKTSTNDQKPTEDAQTSRRLPAFMAEMSVVPPSGALPPLLVPPTLEWAP